MKLFPFVQNSHQDLLGGGPLGMGGSLRPPWLPQDSHGWARAGCRQASVLFKALNAFRSISVQVRGIVRPSVLVCGGFALSANSDLQRWQYLTTPKNSRTCLFVFWSWDRKDGCNPTLRQASLASPQLVAKIGGFWSSKSGFSSGLSVAEGLSPLQRSLRGPFTIYFRFRG